MFTTGLKYLRGILIGLVAAVTALAAWHFGWLESWEAPTWTWRAKFFSQRENISPEIKLVLLDQASLDWAKNENDWGWPWPREVYGAITSFCKRGEAKVFAMDMLFTEPSVYGVSDDESLGEALKTSLPTILAIQPGGNQSTWPQKITRPAIDSNLPDVTIYENFLFPVQEIASGAASFGHVTGTPDKDGVYRRIMPFCRFDNADIPALGLASWLTVNKESNSITKSTKKISLGNKKIPVDKNGDVILRFRGNSASTQAVSAAAVIQSELRLRDGEEPVLSPEIFKNCYVFLGCSAPALLDLRPVPIDPKCPGAALHTTFVDNLLTDSFIAEASKSWIISGVIITSIAAALSLTCGSSWWQTSLFSVLWLVVPVFIGFAAYAKGFWWPVIVQSSGAAISIVGTLAVNYLVEGRQKTFIKQAFRHYLSSEVIEKIIRDPSHLQLGGEKRELTIMFTDLAGFSSFSEKLDPVELTALLNDYLTEMTDIIMSEGGTLDKYEGDAIIAFWNAPLEQFDHAARACRAALRCQRRLAELREVYKKRTGTILRMRAGLNTGDVVVGNMGSHKRFNYTILGDAANLASRLEGANKAFGTETMISENTWRLVSKEFLGRKLADLRVVGKKNAVPVYELTGFNTETAPDGWEVFSVGRKHFNEGNFKEAIDIFSKLPEDPAAKNYIRRCEQLCNNPPSSWDGVWELTEK
ncbi:MAG: adenylate/guanylate cyclase domain-containing protein [Sedimentisphaerales bacterium]|nr:adenylate/guanylate cyclase domain-containing protein [Sedimentisphaerales bacterium]